MNAQSINENTKAVLRAWLQMILKQQGWTPTELARRSRLAGRTITRFLNQEPKSTLSTPTLTKISEASGTPIPQEAFGGISNAGRTDYRIMLAAVIETMRQRPDGPEPNPERWAETLTDTYNRLIIMTSEGVPLSTALRIAHREFQSQKREDEPDR